MAAAKSKLLTLYPDSKRIKYGSLDDDCPEIPCERIYFKEHQQNQRNEAMKLAFFAEHGRHCRSGFRKSHRCRESKETKRSKSGICITGKHLDEQTSAQNIHRNLHQHLIQFYLQKIKSGGWEQGTYYVSDVPEKYVRMFWEDQKRSYKKIICDCQSGPCFINAKVMNDK